MDCAVYLDLVAAHADGVLAGAELASADSHRSSCQRCARVFAESTETRQILARHAGAAPATAPAPDALRRRIARLTSDPGLRVVSRRPAFGRVLLQGAVAALALLALGRIAARSATPMQLMADDVHVVARGEFEPVAGTPAPATAPELSGWSVVGGREGQWGPMRGTMTVYESPDGATLVLHELEAGPSFELPPGGDRVGDRTEYFVDGVLVSVLVRGATVSCLAARMSRDEFHRRVTG